MKPSRRSLLCVTLLAFAVLFYFPATAELLPPGFRPLPLGVHALVGGRIVVRPGDAIESGTVVIRNGLIEAVGRDVVPPADARIWDMAGTTIYAGFIEPYLVLNATNAPVSTTDSEPLTQASLTAGGTKFYGVAGAQMDMGNPGPGYAIARITPEFRAVERYSPKESSLEALREAGFTTGLVAPSKGIIRGTSALVALTEEDPNKVILRPDVFQHIAFETGGGEARAYPSSLMGVIAVIRQSFFDAQHYALERADYEKHPQGRRVPEFDPAKNALVPAAQGKARVLFEPGSALMVDRAAQLSRELGLEYCVVSSGQEWRRPDLAKATGAAFIVPVNFPSLPKLPSDDDWTQVSLDQLRAWDWAPENPALLRQQGLEVALTTYGLGDKKNFRKNIRLALDRGLSEEDALAALTTVPAKLCGVEELLGTIEAGKLADLAVVEGTNYFNADAKVRAVWIDGRIYPAAPEEPKAGKAEEPPKTAKAAAADPNPDVPAKEEPEKHPALPPGGQPEPKSEAPATNALAEAAHDAASANAPAAEPEAAEKRENKQDQLRELQKKRVARSPLEGRGPITNPPAILIRNAVIWTCGPAGILTNAQLLVSHGKILSVGDIRAEPPADALVIDAAGRQITPGIIDCHSHSFVVGDVNEGTLPSTAMVRIRDVVNSETENFYLQLAGGVTTANVLHGSANPIGGQNCVVKLRDGESPEGVIFTNAPEGIKFALGENVKQSNWGAGNTTRFPQTRMGVRTFLQNRFTAAQAYLREWAAYSNKLARAASPTNEPAAALPPPARDLELEAIGEIIQGKRLIHCHSYRQDEILMLLRLMEGFGVRVASLQHVLEGYKVADEIAAHGAGGSTFSDWWAYKFEVYDAIPYNGSLMRDRGVVVSFNSDSSELARRLYLEAAKAVKYGGTPEIEALKFVTLNPAKQLHIDQYVGSLEPGKDADFAVWSKSPLDGGTMCVETWIEGRKYFDRSLNDTRTARLRKERDELLAKAKQLLKLQGRGAAGGDDKDNSFWRVSLEHEFYGRDRHCLDGVSEGGDR